MQYHPTSEKIVGILRDRTQQDNSLFFRVLVGYYFCLAASQMRCSINTPDRGEIPTNMYALNLAPSGYGKTQSMNLMEQEILGPFRRIFLDSTFPYMAERSLNELGTNRANRNGTDIDMEVGAVTTEFKRLGPLLFSFDSGTSPAVKAMRHKLLMARAGSMNLIMDEVGSNLTPNKEVFDIFIELFDKGLVKTKLVKSTADNARSEEILGQVPSNLLMFGVPNSLFDGAKTEEELMAMLATGYARRCFFGYVSGSAINLNQTAEQMFDDRTNRVNDQVIEDLSIQLETLADSINVNKKLMISRENCILLNEYELNCKARAQKIPDHLEIKKRELSERMPSLMTAPRSPVSTSTTRSSWLKTRERHSV